MTSHGEIPEKRLQRAADLIESGSGLVLAAEFVIQSETWPVFAKWIEAIAQGRVDRGVISAAEAPVLVRYLTQECMEELRRIMASFVISTAASYPGAVALLNNEQAGAVHDDAG